jgi:hypothetical protein
MQCTWGKLRPGAIALAGGIGLVLAGLPAYGQSREATNASSFSRSAAQTVSCPTVADKLPAIPASAQAEVDQNLALLDKQISEANQRLVTSVGQGGPNFIQNAILGPLKDKRTATINRIATAIGRTAQRPAGLDALAPCTLSGAADPGASASASADPGASASASASAAPGGAAGGGQALLGPSAADFVDINQVPPNAAQLRAGATGSKGSFVSRCGTNQNKHQNPDNFIVAPGVTNGAHHTHDYVGNLSTDGFSTDQSLLAAGTTCQGGDKSTYYWPVLRSRTKADAAQADQSATDLNIGTIQRPATATLQFRGNPVSKVTAMPQFLKIITGDAKAGTNGVANAKAAWSCTGFTNRVTTDKYPLCPAGSKVMRILDFASCWDGKNIDSANHRSHIVFPDATTGACPAGTKAVPQLHMTLTYNGLQRSQAQIAQGLLFAVDSFPEQLHNPVTDHADFENVMPANLMNRAVGCINRGQRC